MKYKYLLLLLLALPFISGCERSDDVTGIFTGKTWKLTYITVADSKTPHQYNFWGNTETYDKAIKELNKEGAYTIIFSGMESDNIVEGKFSGVLGTPSNYSGSWHADGKSNDFSASIEKNGEMKALLDNYFITGLKSATRYKGDYNNLHLYFTYKDKGGKETDLQLTFRIAQ